MFICLLEDETVVQIDDVYCDIGNLKTGFFLDENGNKVFYRGIVIDVLNFWNEWE